MRGVWIEIPNLMVEMAFVVMSHLVRGVWIEIILKMKRLQVITSHLVRGVWIEILKVMEQIGKKPCRTS